MTQLIDPIFLSEDNFKQAFSDGLEQMLEHDELGTVILVAANAVNEAEIWERLKPKISRKIEQLKAQTLIGADDDMAVFEQLLELNFETLQVAKTKTLGMFELQYNPLRALRPKRMSANATQGMCQDFDAQGFHFNKAFLQKELLFKGKLFSKQISLFYNKFPFVSWHGLVVVEAKKQHPQCLDYGLHQFAWMMANAIGLNIKGFTLAYNSYGAYASVNHFHLQCFIRNQPLPIENQEKYPLIHHWFGSVSDAWGFIETLHVDEQPYHLIYRGNKILVIIRQRQDQITHADWTPGYAWYEACGGVCTGSNEDFNQLDEASLQAELEKLKVD